jgi:selenide, water dikinase
VTGRADPRRLLTNAAAHVGDRLVLTKPIGTGLLATVGKEGALEAAHERELLRSMTTLNAAASRAALQLGATCATDITGFGLLGHASHIARASGVTLRIEVSRVPTLPGARDAADRGVRTGGAERNLAWLQDSVDWGRATDVERALLIDPQTSGGLLVCLSPDRARQYLSLVPGATDIGDVLPAGPTGLVLA